VDGGQAVLADPSQWSYLNLSLLKKIIYYDWLKRAPGKESSDFYVFMKHGLQFLDVVPMGFISVPPFNPPLCFVEGHEIHLRFLW